LSGKLRFAYTALDYAYLAVVAVIAGLIFAGTWFVYYAAEAIGGKIASRLVSYGLWFIGAPLAASVVRKPLSALLGETLGALVETLIPTTGGITNIVYGVFQGLASEAAYTLFRYRKYTPAVGALAGMLAAFPCIALDALLFGEIAPPGVMLLWLVAAMVSGAVYGYAVSYAAQIVVKR